MSLGLVHHNDLKGQLTNKSFKTRYILRGFGFTVVVRACSHCSQVKVDRLINLMLSETATSSLAQNGAHKVVGVEAKSLYSLYPSSSSWFFFSSPMPVALLGRKNKLHLYKLMNKYKS